MRTRILIGIGLLVLVGGLTVAVLDATLFAPVALPTATLAAPATSTSAPAAGLEGTATAELSSAEVRFQIDPVQSEVRYEVGETFFQDNRFAVAVGRTHGISGDLVFNLEQPQASRLSEILIDVSQFTSDETRRDNFIRRNALESARFPLARFVSTSIEGLPAEIPQDQDVTFTIHGELTVKEITRPVTWQVTARWQGDQISGTATTEILMSDFGVGPIRILTLATEDMVNLVFEFVAVEA